MKVLLVVHNFLPNHAAGTEVYTLQLGQELARRGHDVIVFAAEKDISLADLSVREREYGGLRVVELINNLHYADLRETWEQPRITAIFESWLERLAPDVVHFQHLWYLSVGCIEACAARYVPVIFTLHDYWLQCARYGQRVHADSSICHTIEFRRCGECLTSFKFAQSSTERGLARWIARVRGTTGLNFGPAARGAARLAQGWKDGRGGPSAGDAERAARRADVLTERVAERDHTFRERIVPNVYRFLSPSHFLLRRFVEWGIPEERIQFLRTGIDLSRFGKVERTRSEKVRVAFLGTLAPHKAPHLLLEAWQRLAPELAAKAELVLYGPFQHNHEYVAELQRLAGLVGARLAGSLARNDVPRALCSTDLLVVPSVWWENSPLVIVEGIATRTPMLVSDLGGMAELVQPGHSGYHFKVGDVEDLARKLAELIGDRSKLDALYREVEPIKSVARDAEQIEEIYFEAIDALRAARLTERP
ncbi:MAG: glycosyltransferase [Planctomycetes bacterium]|nr:glycosyltransferase [Planctomycetota bacterium]